MHALARLLALACALPSLAAAQSSSGIVVGGVRLGAPHPVGGGGTYGSGCPTLSTCAHPDNDRGGVAVDPDGSVWVGNFFAGVNRLVKVDPNTCAVLHTIPVPQYIGGATHDGTALWVVPEQEGTAYRVDPTTGAVLSSILLPGSAFADPNSSGLAWDGQDLWHADYGTDAVYRIDPNTGAVLDTFLGPWTVPAGLGYRGGTLLLADAGTDTLFEIDPVTGTVLDQCPSPGNPWGTAVAGDGAWVSLNTVYEVHLVDVGLSIGTNYCGPAVVNSSGSSASMSASGSIVVATNAFDLVAQGLPHNSNGYFLNSLASGFQAMPGGSQGNLCLGNPVGRHNQQVQNSGTTGAISIRPDLGSMPRPSGSVAVQPGETWYFTCWFRDANPGVTSNFADGLEVTFH